VGAPRFVIAGVQKGGTTSLAAYLAQHPGLSVHQDDSLATPWPPRARWRRWAAHAAAAARSGRLREVGLVCPYYLFHPHAPRRLAARYPGIKVLVLLRDPADRAVSHYHHAVRLGFERRPLEDALVGGRAEVEAAHAAVAADERAYSVAHRERSYVARGFYARQLEELARWFPPGDVGVLGSEAMFADPQAACDRVADFLGCGRWRLADAAPRNVGGYAARAPERVERWLRDLYRPDGERLRAVVLPRFRDLGHGRVGAAAAARP
jgi:hypothetical protein